jgi:5'-nucleotidase
VSGVLHILHTNDLHSHFHKMPHIATCLRRQRQLWEQRGEHVLTVDIGDHVDRMNVKTEASWGRTNVSVLNRSGYQYVTIGNNEGITFPKEKLDQLYDHATFTVVLGNLLEPATGIQPHWAVPYALHRCGDLNVAILGVTVAFAPFYRMMGWEVREPLELLREQVAVLRSRVDAIIVLSHLGYQSDVKLAGEIPGIDVILGGHTHHLLERGEYVERTLIAQVGRFGDHVGHVQLTFDPADKRITAATAEVFPVKEFPPDQELAVFLQGEKERAEELLSQPVARLAEDLNIDWMHETPFGNFLAASIRRWTGAEVGLANGGLLLAPLKRGDVTFKDLLFSVPHPINPCAITLSGGQLWQVLQRAVQQETVQKELRGFGFRGTIAGWMGVDGLRIEYAEGAERKIVSVEVNGRPLEADREYRVGTIDMFIFNRMYPELLDGRDLRFYLPEMLREVFAQTIGDDGLVRQSFQPRWFAVSAQP